MSKHSILLIGGPFAGKTSFLARLWLRLESGQSDFKLSVRPGDEEYLRKISDCLLAGDFPSRTLQGESVQCSLPLVDSTQRQVELVVPDLSGEAWENLYSKREWSSDFEELVSDETCSCLVFVRAADYVPLLDWVTASARYESSDAVDGAGRTPTEVMLVDWLQMLKTAFSRNLGTGFRPKIGIVFAAWDGIPKSKQASPRKYIDQELSMLSQFVETNSHRFEFGYFGLSATGGDLKNDAKFKEKFKKSPHEHGFVKCDVDEQNAKDYPVCHLISWCLDSQKVGV